MIVITFLSDFGVRDSYVGTVKGIILANIPSVQIIDISHAVSPFDIKSAAYHILQYYKYYPAGTIHLAVVDPGVGGKREALIIETGKYVFIGPDNGLFSQIIKHEEYDAFVINPDLFDKAGIQVASHSHTFHARDIFAPAAAFIATGGNIEEIAVRKKGALQLVNESLLISEERILAGILSIDHFGNIITELHQSQLKRNKKRSIAEIRYKEYIFRKLSRTYGDVDAGMPLTLWGSSGYLEIGINQGNAADFFKADKKNDQIEIMIVK